MKKTPRHRIRILSTLAALAGILTATLSVMAQTPAGTTIRNEATASFRYKSGQSASIRSNMAETVTLDPLILAVSLSLVASPQTILGNGQDTSWLSATVLDAAGNPVPDGTAVFFAASHGWFPGPSDTMTALTQHGIARAPLCSEVVAFVVETAGVTATTGGANKTQLVASVELLFSPAAIQGRVISALDGREMQGAVVVVNDAADSEVGRDTSSAAGLYLVPVKTTGVFTRSVFYTNRFGDQIHTTTPFSIALSGSGAEPAVGMLNAIAGTLLDKSTGQPIRESGIPVVISRIGGAGSALGKTLLATLITDSRGTFAFDSLAPGIYEIGVNHPHFDGRLVVRDTVPGMITVEANLTAEETGMLELVKTANKRIAEPGDAIVYTIDIANTSLSSSLTGIRIIDDLPVGFVYIAQSSRIDRAAVREPAGSRTLVWEVPDTLQPGSTRHLSYTLTIGAGAIDGHGVNRARGVAVNMAGDSVRSVESSLQVQVHPGVFTDRGIVIGKVFFDQNENGIQDSGDKGIAGVELWMEDGTHIVTGDDGKYSLPDVQPGQHVIRVDQKTLPRESWLLALKTEFAGDGSSRFIRLVEGGIVRADFYAVNPSAMNSTGEAESGDPSAKGRTDRPGDIKKPRDEKPESTLEHLLRYDKPGRP